MAKIFFRILTCDGYVVFDNIPLSLSTLVTSNNKNCIITNPLSEKRDEYRCGFSSNEKGSVYILTDEKKYIRSKGIFREFLSLNLLMIDSFSSLKDDIAEKYNRQTKELIHNLITLNGHNIQSVFALVSQQSLTININDQIKIIKKNIEKDLDASARTYLRIAKNNMAMKIEFSVFNKLMESKVFLKLHKYEIRQILLNVLQIFYQEFQDNGIELSLDSSDVELSLDFETINVCFYYIIENAVKYCLPKSKFKIILKEGTSYFKVIFEMTSLEIKKGEEMKLCDFGYRGENTLSLNSTGSGIGLYRAYKTLALNDATIEIKPRISNQPAIKHKGLNYEQNIIELTFIHQKKWA